jgi:hypothetical protein
MMIAFSLEAVAGGERGGRDCAHENEFRIAMVEDVAVDTELVEREFRDGDGAWKTMEACLMDQCGAGVTYEMCPLCHEGESFDSLHDERKRHPAFFCRQITRAARANIRFSMVGSCCLSGRSSPHFKSGCHPLSLVTESPLLSQYCEE